MKALLCGIGIFLLLEGLLPFISPGTWKKYLVQMLEIPEDKIRLIGLVSVALGLILIWFVDF